MVLNNNVCVGSLRQGSVMGQQGMLNVCFKINLASPKSFLDVKVNLVRNLF